MTAITLRNLGLNDDLLDINNNTGFLLYEDNHPKPIYTEYFLNWPEELQECELCHTSWRWNYELTETIGAIYVTYAVIQNLLLVQSVDG